MLRNNNFIINLNFKVCICILNFYIEKLKQEWTDRHLNLEPANQSFAFN
jgi:hypothetical protein